MNNKNLYEQWDLIKEVKLLGNTLTFDNLKVLKYVGWKAKQHHRLCEAYCNETNFDVSKIDRLESFIIKELPKKFKIEFQHDPRGNTCKVYFKGKQIYWVLQ